MDMAPETTTIHSWEMLQTLAASVGILLPETRSEAVLAAYAEYLRYAEMLAAVPFLQEDEPAELLDVERAVGLANPTIPTEPDQ
jgi:hypothetical protein